jgi:hypothetical protein
LDQSSFAAGAIHALTAASLSIANIRLALGGFCDGASDYRHEFNSLVFGSQRPFRS